MLRIGTILGATVHNQITACSSAAPPRHPRVGFSPFVFIHDQPTSLAPVSCTAVDAPVTGIFNVAGDGALTHPPRSPRAWASAASRCRPGCCRAALAVCAPTRADAYGPEQVDFLRYRPVLDNRG
jgi:UDP-glucose 4-epimerase